MVVNQSAVNMKSARNYFNESDLHHSIRKLLKRHHESTQEPTTEDVTKLQKLVSSSKELKDFIQEFPRKSHIQKLSSYLTPIEKHKNLEKKVNGGVFLTKEKAETLFPTVSVFNEYKAHTAAGLKNCEEGIIQLKTERQQDMDIIKNSFTTKEVTEELMDSVDSKENQVKELINQTKQDLESKLSLYEANWTGNQKWHDEIEAFRNSQVSSMTNVGSDIKKLDKKLIDLDRKALYATTFYTYKKNHADDFQKLVRAEKKNLKDEFFSLIGKKLGDYVTNQKAQEENENFKNECKSLIDEKLKDYVMLKIFQDERINSKNELSSMIDKKLRDYATIQKVKEVNGQLKDDLVPTFTRKLVDNKIAAQEEREKLKKEIEKVIDQKLENYTEDKEYKEDLVWKMSIYLLRQVNTNKIIALFRESWTRDTIVTEEMIETVTDKLVNNLMGTINESEIKGFLQGAGTPKDEEATYDYVKFYLPQELRRAITAKIYHIVFEPLLYDKFKPDKDHKVEEVAKIV